MWWAISETSLKAPDSSPFHHARWSSHRDWAVGHASRRRGTTSCFVIISRNRSNQIVGRSAYRGRVSRPHNHHCLIRPARHPRSWLGRAFTEVHIRFSFGRPRPIDPSGGALRCLTSPSWIGWCSAGWWCWLSGWSRRSEVGRCARQMLVRWLNDSFRAWWRGWNPHPRRGREERCRGHVREATSQPATAATALELNRPAQSPWAGSRRFTVDGLWPLRDNSLFWSGGNNGGS